MTDFELLAGLEPEIPGWVLQNRLREAGYVNIWQKIEGLISAGYIERLKRSWYCLGPPPEKERALAAPSRLQY